MSCGTTKRWCAGFAVALFPSVALGAGSAVQWTAESGGNGHWYLGVQLGGDVYWTAARAAAEAMGGHLATFGTQEEFDWVLSGPGSDPDLWFALWGPMIGGLQAEDAPAPTDGWSWITDDPWLAVWGDGDCGADDACGGQRGLALGTCTSGAPVTYNDFSLVDPDGAGGCNGTPYNAMIVEWSADCNGDGIVDYGQILDGELSDANLNGVPDECESEPCFGDLNASGDIDFGDLLLLISSWGPCESQDCPADLSGEGDGVVGFDDLIVLLAAWGPCP